MKLNSNANCIELVVRIGDFQAKYSKSIVKVFHFDNLVASYQIGITQIHYDDNFIKFSNDMYFDMLHKLRKLNVVSFEDHEILISNNSMVKATEIPISKENTIENHKEDVNILYDYKIGLEDESGSVRYLGIGKGKDFKDACYHFVICHPLYFGMGIMYNHKENTYKGLNFVQLTDIKNKEIKNGFSNTKD